MPKIKKNIVKCCYCGKEKEGLPDIPEEALGIGSLADKKGVSGGYGSLQFDSDFFSWTGKQEADGDICDDCIVELLKKGKIKFEYNCAERTYEDAKEGNGWLTVECGECEELFHIREKELDSNPSLPSHKDKKAKECPGSNTANFCVINAIDIVFERVIEKHPKFF